MSQDLQLLLSPVRRRQQVLGALSGAAWGALVGSAIVAIFALGRWFGGWQISVAAIIAILCAAPVVGYATSYLRRRGWHAAAAAIDSHYQLKDRAATALDFLAIPHANGVHKLAVNDALSHLQSVNPCDVVPLKAPRVLPYAVVATIAALLLLFVGSPTPEVFAGPAAPLDVVVAQAERIAEEIKPLEEFAKENRDVEIEKLVNDLKQVLEEMRKPGVDVREALAKLSEMESALQRQQGQYNVTEIDEQLKSLGEALALAEPMAAAGKALARGQLDKAAEELPKIDPPQLDRQTEKSVQEKLEQIAKQMQDAGNSSLGEATDKVSKGLAGNSSSFKEGMGKLGSEAGKQSQRKKLSDILRKQCQCLGECKGECECECNGTAKTNSAKPGGKKAGLAGSGNELADATARMGGKQEMKLTGKQSDEGEVETETTQSPEGKQGASRDYRATYDKYRKISDAVLESEPIPLGYRQSIRRYFESIRPQESDSKTKEGQPSQP